MRHGKRHRLPHPRTSQENLVNFARRNFFAAAIDEFLQPASDEEVAFPVKMTLIPRPKPAAAKRRRVGLWVIRVTASHVRPADGDFARATAGQSLARLVENRHFLPGRQSHRAALPLARCQWVAGYLMRRVRPAV